MTRRPAGEIVVASVYPRLQRDNPAFEPQFPAWVKTHDRNGCVTENLHIMVMKPAEDRP